MSINIVVPPLGESVSEATVAKWHKKVGDIVQMDELLLELETDKVSLEVNSPASGVLEEIIVQEGSSVGVGVQLGKIAENAAGISPAKSVESNDNGKVNSPQDSNDSKPNNVASNEATNNYIASPAANKIALDKNISLSNIAGTGKDNRITKGDVINQNEKQVVSVVNHSNSDVTTHGNKNEPRQERVKMSKLRKTIAERLKTSQNTAAILTTFNEVDMSEVFRIRKLYQEQFIAAHSVKLGFMSFFAKAAVKALKQIPTVNAEIDSDEIVYKNYYDIGVAVGTDQGLVVPVIRDVDKLSFADIEKQIVEMSKKAKDGKLTMADMNGATFTITNGGTYGSLLSTPIINPPQSGILGMHNIVERPVVVAGQIVIRPMMYIALSYDHRIIDGKEAVTFLVKIKQLIENPEKLLFDI